MADELRGIDRSHDIVRTAVDDQKRHGKGFRVRAFACLARDPRKVGIGAGLQHAESGKRRRCRAAGNARVHEHAGDRRGFPHAEHSGERGPEERPAT